jgi:hypothetical protein
MRFAGSVGRGGSGFDSSPGDWFASLLHERDARAYIWLAPTFPLLNIFHGQHRAVIPT